MKTWILMNPHHFLITKIWDVVNVNANRTKTFPRSLQKCFNHESLLKQLKIIRVGEVSREYCSVVLRYGGSREKVRGKILRTGRVSTPCLDDHQFRKECSQIVRKFLYLARIGGPDILWSAKQTCTRCHKMDQSL